MPGVGNMQDSCHLYRARVEKPPFTGRLSPISVQDASRLYLDSDIQGLLTLSLRTWETDSLCTEGQIPIMPGGKQHMLSMGNLPEGWYYLVLSLGGHPEQYISFEIVR